MRDITLALLPSEIKIWADKTNAKQRGVDGQFKITAARTKLKRPDPVIKTGDALVLKCVPVIKPHSSQLDWPYGITGSPSTTTTASRVASLAWHPSLADNPAPLAAPV